MRKRIIKVEWPNGSISRYNSIVACSNALGISKASIHNYLNGKITMGIKFSYDTISGEEELLRNVLNVNKVIRIDD